MRFTGALLFRADDARSLDIGVLDTWADGIRVDRRYTGADGMSSARTNLPLQT